MSPLRSTFLLPSLCASFVAGSAAFCMGQGGPPLSVSGALELAYQGEPGTSYQLETSSDLQSWTPEGPLRFGLGSGIVELLDATLGQQFFHVVADAASAIGPAPSSLAGRILVLNDGGAVTSVEWTDATHGFFWRPGAMAGRAFTCTLERVSASDFSAVLDYGGGEADSLALHFESGDLGTYALEKIVSERRQFVAAGTFARAATVQQAPSGAPAALAGRQIVFYDGGRPEVLEFSPANSAIHREQEQTFPASFAYSSGGGSVAQLQVVFSSGNSDSCQLTFITADAGTFTRQQNRNAESADQDAGEFSLVPVAP